MPTQGRTTTGSDASGRKPRPTQGEDLSAQDQRDLATQRQSETQSQPNTDEDIESSDDVEIGDPVPEDDRTIRARGETGEDEDLPSDEGGIEGSSGERH